VFNNTASCSRGGDPGVAFNEVLETASLICCLISSFSRYTHWKTFSCSMAIAIQLHSQLQDELFLNYVKKLRWSPVKIIVKNFR
jgi:hypothetical protein